MFYGEVPEFNHVLNELTNFQDTFRASLNRTHNSTPPVAR